MRVKMTARTYGSPDGKESFWYEVGEEYGVPDELGSVFVRENWASEVSDKKDLKPAPPQLTHPDSEPLSESDMASAHAQAEADVETEAAASKAASKAEAAEDKRLAGDQTLSGRIKSKDDAEVDAKAVSAPPHNKAVGSPSDK